MKAQIISESLPPGRSFMPYYLECEKYGFIWHFHPNYELFMQMGGGGRCMVGNYAGEFDKGDIIFVGPGLPHVFYTVDTCKKNKPFAFFKIHLEKNFIDNLAGTFSETQDLKSLFESSNQGVRFRGRGCREIIKKAVKLNILAEQGGTESFILLLEILRELNDVKDREILIKPGYRPVGSGYDTRRLDKICKYLHSHYLEHVELTTIAKAVGASVPNLCAFFKKSTGKTIIGYVNALRISLACRLLAETKKPILDIAFASGYQSLSNFNRQFKTVQDMSPREYRKTKAY